MRARVPGTSSSSRSREIVYPDRSRRLLRAGIVAAAVTAAGAILLYVIGQRAVFSPGDVSAHHARIDLKCAQCHTTGAFGAAVESLRCERCHDPAGSDRMLHAAHVFMGSGDRRLADAADGLACATCHRDHRGREFAMTAVDDRECASCHVFRDLRRHPEFAAVRAQATAGVGIDFDHDRHIVEAQKARGEACASCHRQTPDRRGFQPLSFDRDCASCHLKNGLFESETDFVSADLMVAPAAIPAAMLGGQTPAIRANPRGKLQAAGLRHRDPFILYNAARLRRSIDREGDDAERIALRARIQYLQQLQQTPPSRPVLPAERDAAIAALQEEIASVDRTLDDGEGSDDEALAQLTAVAQSVAASLQAVDAGAAVAMPPAGERPIAEPTDPDAAARWERRKAELLAVVDAVIARAAGSDLATRAAALRSRIEQVSPGGPAADTEAVNAALVDRLQQLEDVLRPVRIVPDAGVRAELGGIEGLRQLALERAGGGLSREEFEGRRRELLALLDSIEQRSGDTHRARVSALRRRALALTAGTSGDAETRRRRQQRQRQLDRLLIERALAASPRDADDQPAQDATLDDRELAGAIAAATARLGELERAPRMTAPASEDERLDRANALEALLAPCLKCHQLDATRARMAPVRIAEPVMQRSIFNHAPHVTSAGCETCHSTARASKFATDVNVPGVGACQTCHRPSQIKAGCATCHTYHPRSAASLAVAAR